MKKNFTTLYPRQSVLDRCREDRDSRAGYSLLLECGHRKWIARKASGATIQFIRCRECSPEQESVSETAGFLPVGEKFIPITEEDADRFNALVSIPNENGCRLWIGNRDKFGYGKFTVGEESVRAHRTSWAIWRGEIPNGLQVLHKCDVPACVNVNHLFLGTHQDNMDDKMEKGRQAKGSSITQNRGIPKPAHISTGRNMGMTRTGERHKYSVLTDAKVLEIRARAENGETHGNIANDYGVARSCVNDICRRKSWKHLSPANQPTHA